MSQTSTETKKHALAQLKQLTKVVADTGDFESIREYEPEDATTNPSLILKAVKKDEYRALLDEAISDHKGSLLTGEQLIDVIIDDLLIRFGQKILEIVPGRVSTEVDARLSFDVEASVRKAKELIDLYEKSGISRERVLIKIASTWEGVEAARQLQSEGIRCNMTLMFSLAQAIACADAGAQLISPFVGRIYDWYKKETGQDYTGSDDPGVQSVQQIYNYYKKFGYATEVMGASFRNTSQILELAGCDLLTISPDLLETLSEMDTPVVQKLNPGEALNEPLEKIDLDEKLFRWMMNEDAMATEKLAQGIRVFGSDMKQLRTMVAEGLKKGCASVSGGSA